MYRIRQAVEADFDNGLKECLQAFSPDVVWIEPIKSELLVVAVSDLTRRVIGTAKGIMELKMIHGGKYCMHIEDVAVTEGYREMGIGKHLVASLVEYAKFAYAYKIVLNCDEDVVEWYEHQGFFQHGYAMRTNIDV